MPDLEAQVLSFTVGDLEKNKVKFKAIVMDWNFFFFFFPTLYKH